jgi:hypothetical protein
VKNQTRLYITSRNSLLLHLHYYNNINKKSNHAPLPTTTTMGWTSSLQRLIPRQISKKSIVTTSSSNDDINNNIGSNNSGTAVIVDKQPTTTSVDDGAEASVNVFSPSYLAANMSSLCNEERLVQESKNVVLAASSSVSIRKKKSLERRRQSQKTKNAGANNDDSDSMAASDDDDEDWQDDVILDPATVPNNNHLMVNSERDKHYYCCSIGGSGGTTSTITTKTKLPHLSRCRYLDMLARAHAAELAHHGVLKHSVATLPELQKKLDSVEVGENIVRGGAATTLDEMHQMCMMMSDDNDKNNLCRCNILHPSYNEFGMGTAREVDGCRRLYMVQLFRQHETWKNSFVPLSSCSENNTIQQQLQQLQQQQNITAPHHAQYAQDKDQQQKQQQQQQLHVAADSENNIMETSCCVHLCLQE